MEFSSQQTAHIPEWRAMVENFERDGTQKNPYHLTHRGEHFDPLCGHAWELMMRRQR
jgi:hypothetical protein